MFDLLSRAISLGYSYLTFREEPKLFIIGVVVVIIGYFGCVLGLGSGVLFLKELRHKEFANQGKCVLVITHDLELIQEACKYQIRFPLKTHFNSKGERQ